MTERTPNAAFPVSSVLHGAAADCIAQLAPGDGPQPWHNAMVAAFTLVKPARVPMSQLDDTLSGTCDPVVMMPPSGPNAIFMISGQSVNGPRVNNCLCSGPGPNAIGGTDMLSSVLIPSSTVKAAFFLGSPPPSPANISIYTQPSSR